MVELKKKKKKLGECQFDRGCLCSPMLLHGNAAATYKIIAFSVEL